MQPEPLLQPEKNRKSLFPLRDKEAFGFYQRMEHQRWPVGDIEALLPTDRIHWRSKLTAADRAFYLHVLAMFVAGDRIVNDHLDTNMLGKIQSEEVLMVFGAQRAQESVHNETYAVIPEAILDEEETKRMLECLDGSKALGRLLAWAGKWSKAENEHLGNITLAFAFFEGVVFQAMFASVQMLKERNLMPALTTANELIARDENLHCRFACFLETQRIANKPTQSTAHAMLAEVVQAVDDLLKEMFAQAGGSVPRLSHDGLMQYLRYTADMVLEHLEYDPMYHAQNPYPECDKLILNTVLKTNFFELDGTQYSHNYDLTFRSSDPSEFLTELGLNN